MEEKNEKFSIDTKDLKNETIQTAKKIRESVKGENIKEETKNAKNFIVEIFQNPLEKLKEVANDSSGKYLKTAILLLALWVILIFVNATYKTIYYWGFSRIFSNILEVSKMILAPLLGIVVYSMIVYALNKQNKKSLINIITTITITQLPLILASLASVLNLISANILIITSPFIKLCETIAVILGFFGIKYLFGEEKNSVFIKKYILIQLIYYIAYILISLLGIYI